MTSRTNSVLDLTSGDPTPHGDSSMLFRHALAYFLAKASPGALNFVAVAAYTRLLSPEQYGSYTLAWAGVCLCDALLFQWLRLAMWRFLPLYESSNPAQLLRVVLLAFLGVTALTALAGGIVFAFFAAASWRWLLLASLALLWFHAWFELNLALTNAKLDPIRYGTFSAIRAVVGLVVGVALAWHGYGALGPVLGFLAGAVIASVTMSIGRWPALDRQAVYKATLLELFRYGAPFTGSSAFNFVVHLTDRFILGSLVGASAVGLYAAGFDLAQQSVGMLMMTINLAGYPLITRALELGGNDAGRKRLNDTGNLLLGVAIPSAVGLAAFSSELSTWILGPPFRQTGAILIPIVAMGALLGGSKSFYTDLAFQLGRKTMGQLRVAGLAAAVSLGLNFMLIPGFGVLGAATSNISAQATGLGASILFGRRVWKVPRPSELIRICCASGFMLAVVISLRHVGVRHPVALLSCAAGTYLISAYFLGVSVVRAVVKSGCPVQPVAMVEPPSTT